MRRQSSSQTWFIVSCCVAVAAASSSLPPPPPKIPFNSHNFEQQNEQRYQQQRSTPRKKENVILLPPPPPKAEPNGEQDSRIKSLLPNDQVREIQKEQIDWPRLRGPSAVSSSPRSFDQNCNLMLPPPPKEDFTAGIRPPPPLHQAFMDEYAASFKQSSFGVTQQKRALPPNDSRLPARTASAVDNNYREIPPPISEQRLSSSSYSVEQQALRQPPPPLHQPPDASYEKQVVMDGATFQRTATSHNLGQASTSRMQQQQSSMLLSPRSFSQQQPHQRLPPARQAALAAARRRQPPSKSLTGLQALWKRVEKSLDGLADLEDHFSNGAQRIASSALQSTLTWRRQQQEPSQHGPPPQANIAGSTISVTSSARQQPQQRQRPPMAATRDPSAVVSVVKAYREDDQRVTKERGSPQKPPTNVTNTETPSVGDTIRSTRWTKIMTDKVQNVALQSNGGASQPPPGKVSGTLPPQSGAATSTSAVKATTPRVPPESQQRWPPTEQQPPSARSVFASEALKPTSATASGGRRPPFLGDSTGTRNAAASREAASAARQRINSFYTDEDDKPSLLSRLGKILPPIPRFPSLFKMIRREGSFREYASATLDVWKDDDEDSRKGKGIFGFFRKTPKRGKSALGASARKSLPIATSQLTPPLIDLMERCNHAKTASLLSKQEIRTCRAIGRSRATLDVVCLVFLLLSVHQMPNVAGIPLPFPLADMFSESLTGLGTALLFTLQTWAPFALASAYLTAQTNEIVYGRRAEQLASVTANTAKEAGTYGQLYLRLTVSQPPLQTISQRLHQSAHAQVIGRVEAARLRSFVSFVLTALVVMTVSVVKPIATETIRAFIGIASLAEWRTWPFPWKKLGSSLFVTLRLLYQRVSALVTNGLSGLLDNPYQFAFHVALFVALSAVYFLPSLENIRPIHSATSTQGSDDNGSAPTFASMESLSNMGVSSASRLQLWASGAGIEGALEKWRTMLPPLPRARAEWISRSVLRQAAYGVLVAVLLSLPVLVRSALGISESIVSHNSIFQWNSILDVAVMLLFTFQLSWRAMRNIVESTDTRPAVHSFLKDVFATMEEVASLRKSYMDLQLVASISPTKGLAVRDLWAAHATKRSWAIRGANFECRNGELLVIIGDDGAGKSRLITAVVESMVFPPKEALSTTKVRGLISMGGVDVTKWDRGQLKKRLGLVLNDVRTVADSAELLSGMTLEEILEPSDGLQLADPSHTASANERNSMILGLKMTGLASSLLPRLPTKLSTVVSAREEDLKPSPLRPRCQVLSPSEWSKLLLTRALAQCIFDNDNSARSTDKIENCLVGSLLLLDDATLHMSEVDEAAFLTTLKRTGAACVVTSNKWATGRFADRVVVLRDGVVVESGTHTELLNRGPQHSLYASKWLAMTTN